MNKYDLIYDFDVTAKLEIYVHDWVEVSPDILRSWAGKRRINGEDYVGPVYYFLTNLRDTH